MPMKVDDLKKLDEQFCYQERNRGSWTKDWVFDFLKQHKGEAYSILEMLPKFTEWRNSQERYRINPDADKFAYAEKNKLKSVLYASSKKLMDQYSHLIHKKGSYYWYEDMTPPKKVR